MSEGEREGKTKAKGKGMTVRTSSLYDRLACENGSGRYVAIQTHWSPYRGGAFAVGGEDSRVVQTCGRALRDFHFHTREELRARCPVLGSSNAIVDTGLFMWTHKIKVFGHSIPCDHASVFVAQA